MNQNERVFQDALHAFWIGDEVGRQIAAVELHTFHDLKRRFHRLRFFDGDNAVLADLLHRFGNNSADLLVVVGGNRADLGDHVALHVLVKLADFGDRHFNGLVDAALQGRRARARRNRLHTFAEDRLCQHRRGGRAVAGNVGSLRGDFANHLRAHVLEWIPEFDLLRDRHAVLGDDRRAELLFDYRVPALRTERNLHCIGKSIHAAQNRLARILSRNNLLRHFSFPPEINSYLFLNLDFLLLGGLSGTAQLG
jgi:hypothetical protein